MTGISIYIILTGNHMEGERKGERIGEPGEEEGEQVGEVWV